MIIQCDKCATKFRLDDSRITPNGVKVRCTKCDNVFIVTPPPPPEEVQVEELFGVVPGEQSAPQPAHAGAVQAKSPAPKPRDDNRHLAFDFDSGSAEVTREDIFGSASSGEDAFTGIGASSEKEDSGKKFSLDDLDFSFSSDPGAGEKSEDAWANTGKEPEASSGDFAPGLEGQTGSAQDYSVDLGGVAQEEKESGLDLDFGFDGLSVEKTVEKAAWPEEQEEEEMKESGPETHSIPENVIPFQASAYTKEGKPPAAVKAILDEEDGKDEAAFKSVLSKTIDKDEPISFGGEDADDDEEMEDEEYEEAPRRSQPKMGLIIAALVVVLGGGLIYFTGVIDKLTGLLMPPSSSELKVVEIETIKGFYEENKNFGKVFVIDARVKNITGEPQEIKAATGVIYNDDGDKIAEKSVSPGRMVSVDDIRNLQKEELERAFRDPSGGVIPARGSVPVMVLFVDIPQGLSEFGIDIVR